MPRPPRIAVRALFTTLALAAAVAGCGGSSTNGIASKSPADILSASRAAVSEASSVHVSGSARSQGAPLSLDLELAAGKGAQGMISQSGLSFRLVELEGTIYINGSSAFYSHFGSPAAAQLLQGKWLKAPANSQDFASLAPLTNLTSLFDSLLEHHESLTSGGTTTVAGQQVVALRDGHGGTLYIATTGKPYPVQVTNHGAEGGTITFDRWNAPVSIKEPPNAIDITQLQHAQG
jgi:hypothetical protein